MLDVLRLQVAARMLGWVEQIGQLAAVAKNRCEPRAILIFFHGYSLAHTLRPVVIARALRDRGFEVQLAGRGPHAERVRQAGFRVHDVETMPQSRMDEYVSRGEYGYYDKGWIDRCVRAERSLLRLMAPDLAIHDMKPTVSLSARLEGVDDARITQAYNQPGYPFPVKLVDGFKTDVGPFAEYLACRAAEVKVQRSFFLMADIPEFHPPGRPGCGFHYVGPLLDRPPAPQRLAMLDEGWDTSLPLIYLTCGSSGRAPEYLPELLAAVRNKPYRLLVTTAGRWSVAVRDEQVRVVDFIPGEWVLQRARVLVGIVGIGAIYQALRCGVPIVGAPEHLDQEYHLNRVAALGLGIKVERRAFVAGRILEAVERVLADYQGFRKRCAPFVGYLEKWDGAQAVAELVHKHFDTRRQVYRAEAPYWVEESEFLDYLDSTTPSSLSRDTLTGILGEGMKKGLPHVRQEEKLFFDRCDSWNWLYDREPRFFEADYRALEKKRQRFFVKENGRVRMPAEWQRYRAQYVVRLFPRHLRPGQQVKLFMPYPISRPGVQQDIRLLSVGPGALDRCFAPSLGFFYGYPFEVDQGEEGWEFRYTCELTVREQRVRKSRNALLAEAERRQYLELPAGLLDKPEVVRFLRELPAKAGKSKKERARAIYEELAQKTRFKKTKEPTQNLTYSTVAVLREHAGHCVTLSRAFIALCRAEGIPAREANGALIGYPCGEDRFAMSTWGEPIFGHTWVEIFVDGEGWRPVEFHGMVIGEGAMSGDNVEDPELRGLIKENSPLFFDYYFGRVDNLRLMCSNSVKRIPLFLVEDTAYPSGHCQHWRRDLELKFECRLLVECL